MPSGGGSPPQEPKGGKDMYNIYMQAGLTVYVFASFDNYDDALEVCELYNWEYVDENGFQWSLDLDAM